MVKATINATAGVPQKQEENNGHQNDAFGQIVQHRFRGQMHQVAAIEKRHDLHPVGQNVLVQIALYFFVDL